VVAYVRTVKTASGATAVQIVWSTRRGSRQIEHLGSTHDGGEVEALKAAASKCQREVAPPWRFEVAPGGPRGKLLRSWAVQGLSWVLRSV
jgi:hypothetical protein